MEQILDSLLDFLGLYHLLDFDYPHLYEASMIVLYDFISDKTIPGEMLETFNAILQDYKIFKTVWSRDLFIILLLTFDIYGLIYEWIK